MGGLPMPAMITVLVSGEELRAAEVLVTGETYRHLFRSRRLPAGSRLRLTDGGGAARWGEVTDVGPRQARVVPGEDAPLFEPRRRVALVVAAPRYPRASWLVEKATEMGVAGIAFLEAERSPRSFGKGNLERLRRVAAAALEQCHGARLPDVSGMHGIGDLPDLAKAFHRRLVLDPEPEENPVADPGSGGADLEAANPEAANPPGVSPAGVSLAGVSPAGVSLEGGNPELAITPEEAVLLAVGPEGGWSEGERRRLAGEGFRPWSFGSRILRVETAALVAAASFLFPPPSPEGMVEGAAKDL